MGHANERTQLEELVALTHESCRVKCPECSYSRSNQKATTLSITVHPDRSLYACHHCGISGCVSTRTPINNYHYVKPVAATVTHLPTQLNKDEAKIINFFAGRGIAISDMSALPVMVTGRKYFHGKGEVDAIGFVYGPKSAPTAIKWRSVEGKAFTQDNAAREFYGLNMLEPDKDTLVIVEGEADAVALASIGIRAVSCPNGAPSDVSTGRVNPKDDVKFSFLWESEKLLKKIKKVILAVDQDKPGDALAEEIARRIGRAKCWRTTYPKGCKDITDVIAQHGGVYATVTINKSEPMPLVGVYSARSYTDSLMELYKNGNGKGESTGMLSVDELMTVAPGMLTIVTGVPSSGKSEFIDQLVINLARTKSLKTAIASFENPCPIHLAKLSEKLVGKPFYDGPTMRMRPDELEQSMEFLNEHFCFLENKDGEMATIDSILDRAKQSVLRLGVRCLIIDPYNWIAMPSGVDETKAINIMLSKVTTFCQAYDVHCFFIAHPAKMYPNADGTYPVPKGQSISGSAAWFSKADVGLTVHRGLAGVEIHCWKMRYKWIGNQGMTYIDYDVPTGRYSDKSRLDLAQAHNTTQPKRMPQAKPSWQEKDYGDLEF